MSTSSRHDDRSHPRKAGGAPPAGRAPSLLRQIISSAAERLAQDPRIPPEARQAFAATAVSVFETQVVRLMGGDRLEVAGRSLGGWRMAPSEREARRQRILAAIASGEPHAAIAARERIARSRVSQLAAQLRDQRKPATPGASLSPPEN